MGVALDTTFITKIGETAGDVWRHLENHGPTSMTKIALEIHQPRDLVMLAIGWLAREDKIDVTEEGRKRTVSLR